MQLKEKDIQVLIVDPLSNAFTGKDQANVDDMRHFLSTIDRLRRDAGLTEVVVLAHTGWTNTDRARGSSAIEDWPDAIVSLTADSKGRRFVKLEHGRDVGFEESLLDYDSVTRHMTYTGEGSQREAEAQDRSDALIPVLVRLVQDSPGMTVKEIRELVRKTGWGGQDGDVSRALAQAAEQGLLHRVDGPRNSKLHYPGPKPSGK
jgi:hypothetical protein